MMTVRIFGSGVMAVLLLIRNSFQLVIESFGVFMRKNATDSAS
jgi:hypothetical protein